MALLLGWVIVALWTGPAMGVEEDADRAYDRPLVVGVNSDFPPYEFADANGQAAGFDVDIVRAVAGALNIDVEFRIGDWASVRGMLERGEIDLLAGMQFTEERARRVEFSQRFKSVRYSIFVRRDVTNVESQSDLTGKSIVVQNQTLAHDRLVALGLSEYLVPVDSPEEMFSLLEKSEFDCAVAPLLMGRTILKRMGLENRIVASGSPVFRVDLCFAATKGATKLVQDLDDGLEAIQLSGARAVIYRKWFLFSDEDGLTIGEALRYMAWIAGPMAALLAGALLWTRSLKRQVAIRTKELAKELSDRKWAEAALRQSERTRARTEEIALVMVVHVGLDGRWMKVPPRLCELVGYTEAEMLKGGFRDITHPDDIEADWNECQRLIRGEIESFAMEKRYIHKDGSVIWIDLNCTIVKGEDGVPRYFLTYVRDITERRVAEEALRQSEERYRSLVSATTSMVWTTDANGEFVERQRFWESYTGQVWQTHRGNGWAKAIHPEDVDRVREMWGRALRDRTPCQVEGRVWHDASQQFRAVEASAAPILNDDGSVREWIGTITDIEDRVQAQRDISESRARLEAIMESAMDAMITVDETHRIVIFNRAAEQVFHITSQEAIGTYLDRFVPSRVHGSRKQQADGSPAQDGATRRMGEPGERLVAMRADGEEFPIDASISQTVAGGQKLTTLILRDVTEQERAERRQALMMQELDHRVKNNLAAVISVADVTMAGAESMDEFGEAFRGRILAMARSHIALAETKWSGVDLRGLISQTVQPYQDREAVAVEMVGESLMLPAEAAAAMSMALNELCTNAAKHGALSVADGHVRVAWAIEKSESAGNAGPESSGMVTIQWRESGGPRTEPPVKAGIGTTLLKGLIEHELAGKIELEFAETGLSCTIRFPLDRAAQSAPVSP